MGGPENKPMRPRNDLKRSVAGNGNNLFWKKTRSVTPSRLITNAATIYFDQGFERLGMNADNKNGSLVPPGNWIAVQQFSLNKK